MSETALATNDYSRSEGAGNYSGGTTPSRGRALFVLTLLSMISLLGYYDRFLIGILVQDIRAELHVGDGAIGLLSGVAFAVIYSVLAVPVAAWSDRGRRVSTLALSLTVWSVMSAACGIAANFPMLLLSRVGVAVGEAGGVPTTHALVSEHFSERWRATALSVVVVMSGVGFMAATGIGGWVASRWGWRAAFWVGAFPGPILALVLWKMVRSRAAGEDASATAAPIELGLAMRTLAKRRAFVLLCLGMGIGSAASFASLSWVPAILMRDFAVDATHVGLAYGGVTGLATVSGLALGGVLGDSLSRLDGRWRLWLPALGFLLALPFTETFLFASHFDNAIRLAFPMTFAGAIGVGPAYALVQSLAGTRMRATTAAAYLLACNLIGMGVGPSLTGWLSDLLTVHSGIFALRDSCAIVSFFYLVGGLLLVAGTQTLGEDIQAASND